MASLETYRSKRDFKATAEPKGRKGRRTGDSFVIQKHDARRLHYDFRLEMDGVLKSWAVTRGPSLVPGEKRLAVHVEDHPLEYGTFEGTIPKGEYGGGTVIVWDRGRWTPIGDPAKAYRKGHLEFELEGEKLSGRWHLVRMAGKPREKRENWLLIKGEDGFSRAEGDADILEERPESVKTERVIADVEDEAPGWSSKTGKIEKQATGKSAPAAGKRKTAKASATKVVETPDPSALKGAKKGAMPAFVEPVLATLVAKPPSGERWLHEIKFDGYRLQARVEAGRVKLLTRTGLDWTKKFGKTVPSALAALPVGTAIIDGELVVEGAGGASDFSALQAHLSEGRSDGFLYYAFDLLYLDGHDLQRVPLVDRKAALERLIGPETKDALRYSAHFEESGGLVLRHTCRLGLEGIISKDRTSPYRSGRGKTWVKSKCVDRQELVIGGYAPSTAARNAIGSLVLGVYHKGGLSHVGRVGTGFSHAVARDLFARLEKLRADTSPFSGELTADEGRKVRYVRPELVAEIEFRGWTGDHKLRHASFRGLREDKPAEMVVAEGTRRGKAMTEKRTVKLTHPDRTYWPDAGVTKEGLADYYSDVWRRIAPFIVGRPLALLRCPEGIEGPTFFQKHAWKGIHKAIRLVADPKDKGGEPFIAIDDLDGLIALVQASVLEIHPWGSTIAHWEKADTLIMDLDPGEETSWEAVLEAAGETRRRLEDAGLSAFVKTSGGKGLHVVAPLTPKATWPTVKAFTKQLADRMAADSPDLYVSTISKAKRRGKVLIDYLRNQRGMTAVAPFSTRARPGAAVSMPLHWDELSPDMGPDYFTVTNAAARLDAQKSDPWADFEASAVPLPAKGKLG